MDRYSVIISLSIIINCTVAMEPAEKSVSKKNKESFVTDFDKKISSLLDEEESYNTSFSVPVGIMLEFNQALKRADTPTIIDILTAPGSRVAAFRNSYRPAQLAYGVYKGEIDSIVISPDDIPGISLDSFRNVLLELAQKGGNREFLKKYSVRDSINPQDVRTEGAGYVAQTNRATSFNLAHDWFNSSDQSWQNDLSEMYANDFLLPSDQATTTKNTALENSSTDSESLSDSSSDEK